MMKGKKMNKKIENIRIENICPECTGNHNYICICSQEDFEEMQKYDDPIDFYDLFEKDENFCTCDYCRNHAWNIDEIVTIEDIVDDLVVAEKYIAIIEDTSHWSAWGYEYDCMLHIVNCKEYVKRGNRI